MPDWDDGRTWPRQPRSHGDAIRWSKKTMRKGSGGGGKKNDGCPLTALIVLAVLGVSATASISIGLGALRLIGVI